MVPVVLVPAKAHFSSTPASSFILVVDVVVWISLDQRGCLAVSFGLFRAAFRLFHMFPQVSQEWVDAAHW